MSTYYFNSYIHSYIQGYPFLYLSIHPLSTILHCCLQIALLSTPLINSDVSLCRGHKIHYVCSYMHFDICSMIIQYTTYNILPTIILHTSYEINHIYVYTIYEVSVCAVGSPSSYVVRRTSYVMILNRMQCTR